VEVLKAQLKTLKDELKRAHQPLDALQKIEEQVEVFEEEIQKPVKRRTPARSQVDGSKDEQSTLHGPLKLARRLFLRVWATRGRSSQ